MRRWLPITAILISLAPGTALAQASIEPDPRPRLPPQPGQGLPEHDQAFLQRAAELSAAQIEAGRLATDRASDDRVRGLAGELMDAHEEIATEVEALASDLGAEMGNSEGSAGAVETLGTLEGLEGTDFDRAYLEWQLRTHVELADLYQTEASQSPVTPLAGHAIRIFADIQEHVTAIRELAGEYGIDVDLSEQPPQY